MTTLALVNSADSAFHSYERPSHCLWVIVTELNGYCCNNTPICQKVEVGKVVGKSCEVDKVLIIRKVMYVLPWSVNPCLHSVCTLLGIVLHNVVYLDPVLRLRINIVRESVQHDLQFLKNVFI